MKKFQQGRLFPEGEITPFKVFRYAGEELRSNFRPRNVDQELKPKSLISNVGLLLHAGFCAAQCKFRKPSLANVASRQ